MFHRHKLTVVCPNKWPFSLLSILPILSPFPITLVPGLPSLLSIFQHSRHKTCILYRPSFDKTAFHLIRKGIAIVFIISSVIGYNLFIAYKLIMTITRSCFYFDPAIRLLPSLPRLSPPSLPLLPVHGAIIGDFPHQGGLKRKYCYPSINRC